LEQLQRRFLNGRRASARKRKKEAIAEAIAFAFKA